jgi:hypothetical protein
MKNQSSAARDAKARVAKGEEASNLVVTDAESIAALLRGTSDSVLDDRTGRLLIGDWELGPLLECLGIDAHNQDQIAQSIECLAPQISAMTLDYAMGSWVIRQRPNPPDERTALTINLALEKGLEIRSVVQARYSAIGK